MAASFDGDAAGAGGGDGHVSAAVDFDCTAAGSLVDGHGARGAPPKGVVFADVDGPGSGMVLPDINAGAANDRDLAAVGIDTHAPAREGMGGAIDANRHVACPGRIDGDIGAADGPDAAVAGLVDVDGACGKHIFNCRGADDDIAGGVGVYVNLRAAIDGDRLVRRGLVDIHRAGRGAFLGLVADGDLAGARRGVPDGHSFAAIDRNVAVGVVDVDVARRCGEVGALLADGDAGAGGDRNRDICAAQHLDRAAGALGHRDGAVVEHVLGGVVVHVADMHALVGDGVYRDVGAAVDVHVAKAAGLIDSHCAGWRMVRILVTDGDAAVAAGRITREYLVANGDIVSAHDCDVAKLGVDHNIPGGAVEITALDADDHITGEEAEDPDVVAADNAHGVVAAAEFADHDIARGNHRGGGVANCDIA